MLTCLLFAFLFILINPAAKNKNKSSPIKSIHTHLTGTKRRDDIDESSTGSKVRRNNDKPKPRKQNKTMSKMRKNGGVLADDSGKFNSTTISYSR